MRIDTEKLYEEANSLLNSCIDSKKEEFVGNNAMSEEQAMYFILFVLSYYLQISKN